MKTNDPAMGMVIRCCAGADINEHKCGLSWLWIVIGLPIMFWFMGHWIPILLSKHMSFKMLPEPVQQVESARPTSKLLAPAVVMVTQSVERVVGPVVKSNVVEAVSPIWCTGYAGGPEGWQVMFSDGSMASTKSGRSITVAESFVVVDGTRYPVRPGKTPVMLQSVDSSNSPPSTQVDKGKIAFYMTNSLDVLQARFKEDEANIEQVQVELDSLRRQYNIVDKSHTQLYQTNQNGEIVITSQEPYWVEKRKLAAMIEFHKVVQARITAVEIDQQIRTRNANH